MSALDRVARIWITGIVFALGWPSGVVHAEAGRLGIIGDSMAQAINADDDCTARNLYECLDEKLLEPDARNSFAGGDPPWSLREVLGFDRVVDASRSGADWGDAPSQAQKVMARADVRAVFVLMGHNDVCQSLGQNLPPLAEVEARIDETLTHLTQELPTGGAVYIAGLIDIVQIRDLMKARDHHPVFESCQAVWDLDFTRVKDSAIAAVCEHFFGSGCSSRVPSFFLLQSYDALALLFRELGQGSVLGREGSCGNILNSASNPLDVAAARRYNMALNDLLQHKASEYRGREGVRVEFLAGLFAERIRAADVSTLDCFHPSRAGQRHIAEVLGLPILARSRAVRSLPTVLDMLLKDGNP